MTRRRNEEGFTLIELLISLAVMGMTAALLLAGLVGGQRLWAHTASRADGGQEVAAAQMILRERSGRLVPVIRYDGSAPFADVRGTGDMIAFFGPPSDADRPGDLQRYRLMLDPSGVLILYSVSGRSSRIDLEAPSVEGWRAAALIEGASRIELGYYGAAPPDNNRRWRNRWQDQPRPPELIRLRLAFPEGDRRIWPDLIVHPVAAGTGGCAIDPLTGRCRGQG